MDTLADKIYALSHQCGMNQRYYQIQSTWWWGIDMWVLIIVAALALASAVVSIVGYFKGTKWNLGSAALSIASLFCLMVLNIWHVTATAQFHSDMYRRWSDLRQEVDSLEFETNSKDEVALERELKALVAKKNSLQALEPYPDMALVEKCWEDENESRTSYRTTDPSEKKRSKGAESTSTLNPTAKLAMVMAAVIVCVAIGACLSRLRRPSQSTTS